MQNNYSKINILSITYLTISFIYLIVLWSWYIYGYEISANKVGNNKNDLCCVTIFFASSQFLWFTFKIYFNKYKIIQSIFHIFLLLLAFPLIHSSGKIIESIIIFLLLTIILSLLSIKFKTE